MATRSRKKLAGFCGRAADCGASPGASAIHLSGGPAGRALSERRALTHCCSGGGCGSRCICTPQIDFVLGFSAGFARFCISNLTWRSTLADSTFCQSPLSRFGAKVVIKNDSGKRGAWVGIIGRDSPTHLSFLRKRGSPLLPPLGLQLKCTPCLTHRHAAAKSRPRDGSDFEQIDPIATAKQFAISLRGITRCFYGVGTPTVQSVVATSSAPRASDGQQATTVNQSPMTGSGWTEMPIVLSRRPRSWRMVPLVEAFLLNLRIPLSGRLYEWPRVRSALVNRKNR